ncbi:hypothetical protein [Altericista sp. CCNU0014]|uniref:hypothetical protein n=1 Tax=Altericista sp. CCNU0014 TaxID=3082949 RepID=UPI00384A70CC
MPTAVQPERRAKSASRPRTATRENRGDRSTAYLPAPLQLVPQMQPSRKLALLIYLRRISTPVALVMILGILPIYGWSVSTQLSWGKRYQHLDKLRRDEREYKTVTETLKYDLTQKAMQNPVGLVPQGPSNSMFIPAMPPRSRVPAATSVPVQVDPAVSAPLAY